jgi:hypothetical protein
MRRANGVALAVGLIAASFSIAFAQSSVKKTESVESIAEAVSVLDHIWLDAAFNHDTGTMAWLFAKDFVEVHPGGEIVNGQQQIKSQDSPEGDTPGQYSGPVHFAGCRRFDRYNYDSLPEWHSLQRDIPRDPRFC